jgi:hypothetical protein
VLKLPTLTAILAAQPLLQRIRVGRLWIKYSEDIWVGFPAAYAFYLPDPTDLQRLASAAPGAVLNAGLHCILSEESFMRDGGDDTPARIEATYNDVAAVLRRDPPFSNVHLHSLELSYFFQRNHTGAVESNVALFALIGTHDSLKTLQLYGAGAWSIDDGEGTSLKALVDACAALPRLESLELVYFKLPPAPLQQFIRLLAACKAVRILSLDVSDDFVTGPDVADFCDVLRDSRLETLSFRFGSHVTTDQSQFEDGAAGELVLAAAKECVTLRTLQVNNMIHRDGKSELMSW